MKSKYNKIALGGLSGTGKGTISKMLAEKLGFTQVSAGGFAREIAKEKGMTMFEFDQNIQTDPEAGEKLDIMIDQRTEEYGKTHENFVAEGRLAAHFVKDAFKVLLTANDEERGRRISKRDGTPDAEALREAKERDQLLSVRYAHAYNLADFDHPKYYDLAIDTSNLTPTEILEIIINAIT